MEKRKIQDEKVLERWSVLIEDAHGKGEMIYNKTVEFIQQSQPPDVDTKIVKIRTDQLENRGGFFAKHAEREYLMAINRNLKDYRMYISARDYGKSLFVSWYLTCEPGFVKRTVSKLLTENPQAFSFALDIFKQEDLTAYVTVVHHALKDAVEEMSKSVGFDFAKVDQKSKGFLNIS